MRDGNLAIASAYFSETLPIPYDYKGYFEQHPTDKPYKPGWYTCIVETHHKFDQCYSYFECRANSPLQRVCGQPSE